MQRDLAPANNAFVDPGFGLSQRQEPRCDYQEQSLLGSIILSQGVAYFKVASFLKDENFFVTGHQRLYAFMAHAIEADHHIDIHTLGTKIRGSGILEGLGENYLKTLLEAVVDPGQTVVPYARDIVECHRRRVGIGVSGEAIDGLFGADPTLDADAVITKQVEALTELVSVSADGPKGASFAEALDDAVEASSRIDRGEVAVGLSYGMPRLEEMIGVLRNSWLYLLGGRPGQGKSALAKQIVLGAAKELRRQSEAVLFGEPPGVVLFFSLEMLRQQVATWMACELAGIDNAAFSRVKTADEANAIRLAQIEAEKLRAHIHIEDNDGSPLTIRQVSIIARGFRTRKLGPVRLIVVDHVQKLLKAENAKDQTAATAKITSTLKDLARALKTPVMGLAHLNKDVGRREEDSPPQLEDLKHAGEEDADVVFFLHRPEVGMGETPPDAQLGDNDKKTAERRELWRKKKAKWKNRAQLVVRKRREGSGPTEIILGWRGPTTSFYEVGTPVASNIGPEDADGMPF